MRCYPAVPDTGACPWVPFNVPIGRTCSFVDAQHGYPDTHAPRRDLRHIVHQGFQPCASFLLLFQLEDHAQVLRQFAQPPYILLYQLGRSMVVVEDREDSVDDGMVSLSYSNVQREKGVDDCVDQEVELCLEERPDRLNLAL